MASSTMLARITGVSTFSSFDQITTKSLVVQLQADYKDPFNWNFEIAAQPTKIRAGLSAEMLDAMMSFVSCSRRTTAMLEGILPLADGLTMEGVIQSLLDGRLVVSRQMARNEKAMRKMRRKKLHYADDLEYVVNAPPALAMRALELYMDILNRNSHAHDDKAPRVPAPWRSPDRPKPGDDDFYTMEDVKRQADTFEGVMSNAASVDEVDGLLWVLEAVTPRPPTAEDPTPGLTRWCPIKGYDDARDIVKVRVVLESGRMAVYTCTPEVRVGSRDGEIYQKAVAKGYTPSGKPKLVWTQLAGLPPLANDNLFLSKKFVPRKDILSAAPRLQEWMVGDKAAELAAITHWTSVGAADRQAFHEMRDLYIRTGSLRPEHKPLADAYTAQFYMAYLHRQFLKDQQFLKEVQDSFNGVFDELDAGEKDAEESSTAPALLPESASSVEASGEELIGQQVDAHAPIDQVLNAVDATVEVVSMKDDDEAEAQELRETAAEDALPEGALVEQT